MESSMKKIVVLLICVSLTGIVMGDTNIVNRMYYLPSRNPIFQKIVDTPIIFNIQQVPTVNAIDARLLIDGNGNVLAMALINPVELKQQVQTKTFRQKTTEHFSNNWGKWAIGTLVTGVGYAIGENNNWFSSKSSGYTPLTLTTTGNNNTYNINNFPPQCMGGSVSTGNTGSGVGSVGM
jgi:hypothetical protein